VYLEISKAESPQQYLLRVLQITEAGSPSDDPGTARFNRENPASLAPPVWNETPRHEALIDVVKLSGVTVSIGLVVWALRTGGLLASLAASIPIWMRFDPLPILVFEDDDDEEQDESDWGVRSDADREGDGHAVRDLFRSGRSVSRSEGP
jgi:hypothetical protein